LEPSLGAGSPASIAGLPGRSACVSMDPPLSASGASTRERTSDAATVRSDGPAGQPSADTNTLKPKDVGTPPASGSQSIDGEAPRRVRLPARIVFAIAADPRTPPVLSTIVLPLICASPRDSRPPARKPSVLPLIVTLSADVKDPEFAKMPPPSTLAS